MKARCIFCTLLVLLLIGCSVLKGNVEAQSGFVFAMDTFVSWTIYHENDCSKQIEERIHELESILSTTDINSEIHRLNDRKSYVVSSDTRDLLSRSLKLCERTDGVLDISIYPIVKAWGFTTGSFHVPSEQSISQLVKNVNYRKIEYDADSGAVRLPEEMEIDLGSLGKGYVSEQLIQMLKAKGIKSALVNIGGNIQVLGGKINGEPWLVGLRNPFSDGCACSLKIKDKAVVTSGGYERYFEEGGVKYCHIINPNTGIPIEGDLASVTVVGEDAVACDGLSTSLFIMGLEEAEDFWRNSDDFEAIFITKGGQITITEGLQSTFSLSEAFFGTYVSVLSKNEK
ncbi:FAD:protein FMN transferase [Tissierella praeacuta]|uniref:FAD:protein FMN transferase n=1 Tax=Tissierella praeacuta TaxID=43131 RepID=UPI003DA612F6